MSATSKLNIRNIETQHPQHQKLIFTTSKKFRSNFETFTWNTRNTARTWMQHIHTDCNMNDKRLHHECDQLQHAKNIIPTPIYNGCNIKKSGGDLPRARPRCRGHP
jgi:hypothetical protein